MTTLTSITTGSMIINRVYITFVDPPVEEAREEAAVDGISGLHRRPRSVIAGLMRSINASGKPGPGRSG